MNKAMLETLSTYRDVVFNLQVGMTSFPSFSPTDGGVGEWDKAVWLEKEIRSWGIDNIEHFDAPDDRVPAGKRPNLVVRIPGKSKRTLWIIGHLDVVPPGEMSLWKTDPWQAVYDENDPDIIRGRGVEDNQQSVVAGLLIAKALKENNIVPDYSFALLLVSDEETHNTYGINYILKEQPDLIARDDLVLVPDYGSAEGNFVEVAEKGVLWLKVSVTGKQCHASTPEDGVNALLASAHMITRLQEIEDALSIRDDLFVPNRSTIVPTKHDANVPNINTLSGKEVFYIDCRILPDYSLEHVTTLIQKLGDDIANRFGVEVAVEVYSAEPTAKATDPQSEVVLKLMKAIKAVYNRDCRAGGAGGSTVAGSIRPNGTPVAAWASAIPNYHQPNEGSHISFAIGDAKVFAHLLFEDEEKK